MYTPQIYTPQIYTNHIYTPQIYAPQIYAPQIHIYSSFTLFLHAAIMIHADFLLLAYLCGLKI